MLTLFKVMHMINCFKNYYSKLDKETLKILKNGWIFCAVLCAVSLLFLVTYLLFFASPFLYKVGISIFQLSLIFFIEFLVCGYVVDSIKKGN